MKNKKGFTLIELLAIIVILAIIAVITVPIILNVIENSKRGAATDSAFGYKDAVQKFYVTQLSVNPGYNFENGGYTTEQLKSMGVSVGGKEPGGSSWIAIQNNNVANGCLQFDEYHVFIQNGVVGQAEKGTCEYEPLVYTDTDSSSSINLGDGVSIGDEEFWVLEVTPNDVVKLLPKYNLGSDYKQVSSDAVRVLFAGSVYWWDSTSSNVKSIYPRGVNNKAYVYTRDNQNNAYDYVEKYKSYLSSLGPIGILDARLISYDESTLLGCNPDTSNSCAAQYVNGQTFWTGSASYVTSGDEYRGIYAVNSTVKRLAVWYGNEQYTAGIRPVIEVGKNSILASQQ